MGRSRAIVPAVIVALLAVAGCSSTGSSSDDADPVDPGTVTIASFNFSESELLAEIYSQALEADGYPVARSFALGPRELVVPALVGGLVDFVPEYAGTALQFLSAGREDPQPDSAATHGALRRAVSDLPVRALAPAPAQDANAFVVAQGTADRYGLVTLSDLAAVAGSLVFGGPPECPSRPLCIEGLDRVYGITFADVVALDAGGPLTHQALDGGGVDVALLFTTDPSLDDSGIVELTDDRQLQPSENVTPLIHDDVVAHWGPELVERIDRTSVRLTTAVLRRLNEQVASGTDDVATIAARWLEGEGLA
jgi:osmoprotectant transport system substrate-binding protein